EVARHVEPGPLGHESALRVEHLDALILAVGDVDLVATVDGDEMDDGERAGPGSGLPPGAQQRAIGCEAMDAAIAIAVRNVDLAVRREGDAGRHVEGPPVQRRRWHV